MILCLCVGVSDQEFKKLIDAGKTLEEIQRECGAGLGCGSCVKMLQDVLNEQTIRNNPEQLEGLTEKEALAKIPHSVMVRVVRVGELMTMEFNPDRLNLHLDKDSRVSSAKFG